jgi:ABC-2 type transport system permease protein
MSNIVIVAIKEFREAIRSKRVLILMMVLTVAMVASVWIGSISFGVQMRDYNLYFHALPAALQSQALKSPQFFPLTLLRGGIEYLEILGALFAFLIAYSSISRERSSGTSLLLLSRPITKVSISLGKILGLSSVWLLLLAINFLAAIIALLTIGNARLSLIDYERLGIALLAAFVYIAFWTILAITLGGLLKRYTNAIYVGISIWLTVVLIMPQIGDTMDPDNQVPGGLFASLGVVKANEISVLSHFHTFDVIRNGIEVSSITKLFERIAFAFLGIKDKYNQMPLRPVLGAMNTSILGILGFISILIIFSVYSTKNHKFLRRS